MLVQLHLLLFLCSPSLSQTPPGGNLTFGEDGDVESMEEQTSGEEIEEEDIIESVNKVVQKQDDKQKVSTDPMEEFEASQKALSDAWKELGDAEVAAEEVKRRLTKWQERYSHRLNVFVSWMMANSLCYDERINNTDITQLWRHSRSITEDIAQAETKLRDLRKERAQEVRRVAEAREEVQEARSKHSGARDKLEGKSFAPIFSSNIHLIYVTYLLPHLIVSLSL